MGPICVLYGQNSLYGAHVGSEWGKCPDSAHIGPLYTCLLGRKPDSEYGMQLHNVLHGAGKHLNMRALHMG